MAVSISIAIVQNSQSIANNTSNVTVSVTAKWTGGSHNRVVKADGTPQANGWVTIDGDIYNFASTFNDGETTSGSKVICTKTVDVTHDSTGAKTLACSASYTTHVSSGTVTASASKALTTIPRKSTLAASNGKLGTAQTLTVTKQASSFTHTITYKCGSASGTICTKSSETSISWTPPLSLASQNTQGDAVVITLTITTYNGSTSVGSNTKHISCAIPASVKPTVSLSVSDPTGYADTWGVYIQSKSKLKIVVSASGNQGSTIKTYSVSADGKTYTTANITTGFITGSGTLTINVTVTDSRGRTATASTTISVRAYEPPKITSMVVRRCNADGTENSQGQYGKVIFSAVLPDVADGCLYFLEYKKVGESSYTTVDVPCDDNFTPTNITYVFPADKMSSYNVRLTADCTIESVSKNGTLSAAKKLWSVLKKGLGFAFGKIAELENVLDIAFQTRFTGGILYPVLEPETDLNDVMTPNTYTGANISHNSYTNCPVISGTFTLVVESCGEDGQLKQTYTACSKYKPERFSRFFYQGEWGAWCWANTDEYILYENNSGSNAAITLAASLSHFRYVEIYFTDNNGKSGGYTKVYSPNGKTVSLRITEPSATVYNRQTFYSLSGTSMTPDITNASYYRVNSSGTITTSFGTNYIKIIRVIGRA